MADPIAIAVNRVSKSYRIWDSPSARLASAIMGSVANVLPRPAAQSINRKANARYRDFFALEDISLDIKQGESVGIIGLNGSGKSTLLQIIAGTVQPTSGEVTVSGRIAALLELGSGFNPEFTGRENVYLNAAVLGLGRREVDEQFDDIAAFADIGEFIDQPVKTYSSGMFVRLAFAVSTHVSADVLLIDEALTVGDIFFQQKCYVRLNKLKDRGVAIVLVTHGMNDVEQFCSRAFLLHQGRLYASGKSVEVVKHYYLLNRSEPITTASATTPAEIAPGEGPPDVTSFWPPTTADFHLNTFRQVSDNWARLSRIAVCDPQGVPCRRFEQGGIAVFYYEFEILKNIEVPVVGLVFFNNKSVIVHGKSSLEYGSSFPSGFGPGARLRFRHEVALELAAGEYTFEVGLASVTSKTLEEAPQLTHFELMERTFRHCHVPDIGPLEVAFRQHGRPVQLLHHGIANLPGAIEWINPSSLNDAASIEN